MSDSEWFLNDLRNSLRVLGLETEEQIDWLRSIWVSPYDPNRINVQTICDELAENFFDVQPLGPQMQADGTLSGEALDSVNAVGDALEAIIATDNGLMTHGALRSSSEWRNVRRLARHALAICPPGVRGLANFDLWPEHFETPRDI
jgi:hypothetical protein